MLAYLMLHIQVGMRTQTRTEVAIQSNSQNGQNGLKWSKMVPNGPKWFKMVKNGEKWSKSPKMVKIAKNGQNRQKWSKLPKMVKMV